MHRKAPPRFLDGQRQTQSPEDLHLNWLSSEEGGPHVMKSSK